MNRKWGAGILAAAMLLVAVPQAQAKETISEDIYQWVQSTSRQNYYFNKQHIYFGLDAKGQIDLNTLLVPVLKTYDQVQKEDVIAKRRWKMQKTEGYNDLAGAAQYLRFNLQANTVEIIKQDDLDSDWGVLDTANVNQVIDLTQLSEKGVKGKFYQAILGYSRMHLDEILERTEAKNNVKLNSEGKKQFAKMKNTVTHQRHNKNKAS
ncbi:MAG: hypothetical protein PT949_03745 [Selenomonadales bacterium]|nr:hypothetical protein [Selenomonadales bacterium]